jgi:hypothetical protein
MKIAMLTSIILMLATKALAEPCKIAQSVYHDSGGKGFELVFGESIPGIVMSYATATISHLKQKKIYSFSVTQSNGYGSIAFLSINPTKNGLEYGNSFGINFFDQNFRSANPGVLGREVQAPKYVFISDLGRYDYYKKRSEASNDTSPLLGEVVWVHEHCR